MPHATLTASCPHWMRPKMPSMTQVCGVVTGHCSPAGVPGGQRGALCTCRCTRGERGGKGGHCSPPASHLHNSHMQPQPLPLPPPHTTPTHPPPPLLKQTPFQSMVVHGMLPHLPVPHPTPSPAVALALRAANGVMDFGVDSVHSLWDGMGYLYNNALEALGFGLGRARVYTEGAATLASDLAGTAYGTAASLAGTAAHAATGAAAAAADAASRTAGTAYGTATGAEPACAWFHDYLLVCVTIRAAALVCMHEFKCSDVSLLPPPTSGRCCTERLRHSCRCCGSSSSGWSPDSGGWPCCRPYRRRPHHRGLRHNRCSRTPGGG